MINTTFDKAKSINSLIYIANKIGNHNGVADKYKALKILYFAEIKHLKKYGRLITNDAIARMPHGSTPSSGYDLLKKKSNEPSFQIIDNNSFKPAISLDIDVLSESDIECIIESINENQHLSFPELKAKAHDTAYNKAEQESKSFVPLDYIIEQENLSIEQASYIKEHYDFLKIIECLPH